MFGIVVALWISVNNAFYEGKPSERRMYLIANVQDKVCEKVLLCLNLCSETKWYVLFSPGKLWFLRVKAHSWASETCSLMNGCDNCSKNFALVFCTKIWKATKTVRGCSKQVTNRMAWDGEDWLRYPVRCTPSYWWYSCSLGFWKLISYYSTI